MTLRASPRPSGGWIPTRSATPATALVPQRKGGFPIPNAGLLLGFHGTKTVRREGISSPFSDAGVALRPRTQASPSFVRQPEGNGVAERFIRTLKENLLWVRSFKTIEELRAELVAFARRYNETWLVARHGYKTPARVRQEQTMPRIAIDPTLAATLPLAA